MVLRRTALACCCAAAAAADADWSRDVCVVGAGAGGLQLARLLHNAGRDFVVFDRAAAAGSFYASYPVHRTLISLNKRNTGRFRCLCLLRCLVLLLPLPSTFPLPVLVLSLPSTAFPRPFTAFLLPIPRTGTAFP